MKLFNFFLLKLVITNFVINKFLDHLDTVKALIDGHANVTIKSSAGQTPRDMAKSKFIGSKRLDSNILSRWIYLYYLSS